MNMHDFLDLDKLERETREAYQQLARRMALCAVLGLVATLIAIVVP